MGLFSAIGNVWEKVKSIFRPVPTFPLPPFPIDFGTHSSTITTTYKPDRVKAAQLENERVELMRQARLDIIEAETRSRIAQEQAQAQGFAAISQAVTAMQEKLNDIAQKRIAIIEGASLQAVKDAEEFYGELEARIKEDNDRYTLDKLPALLEILGKYEEGSPAQRLYMRKIDEDISLQIEHTARQLEAAAERQGKIIEGILYVKGRVAEQTGQISEAVNAKLEALGAKMPELPKVQEVPALPQ